MAKKQIRNFRKSVFERDQYRCAICKRSGQDGLEKHQIDVIALYIHHITSRASMPKDVIENCITLCASCSSQVESNSVGFDADDLYEIIGGDYLLAVKCQV